MHGTFTSGFGYARIKYLPNGIELKLRLNRASNIVTSQFCLMVTTKQHSNEDYQHRFPAYPVVVKIDTATLSVRHVQLLPAIANDLNQSIARHNAKFPIRRVEVKTFTIGSGMRSKIEDHLFQGQLPKRVFLGMVSNEAFNGSADN